MNKYRFFSSEAVLHILAWLFIFSMPLIFHHGQQQVSMRDYFLGLFMSLMLFVTFYTNYFVLAPCLFMKGRKKAFFILEIILLIVVVIIVQEVFTSYAPPIRHAGGLHHMHAGPARWMFVIRDFVTLSLSAAASWIGPAVLLCSALMTAAYLLTVVIRGFFPGDRPVVAGSEAAPSMVLPMLLLAAISVILGLVPNGIIGFIQGILSF